MVELDESQAAAVRFGRALADLDLKPGRPSALFDPGGDFLALYEPRGDVAKPVAVFV